MEIYYRHLRATLLTKDYTLCGVENIITYEWSGSSQKARTLLIGLAITHPNDFFSKKIGRELSYENAHIKPFAEIVIQEGDSVEYTLYKYASTIIPKQAFHREILRMSREEELMIIE